MQSFPRRCIAAVMFLSTTLLLCYMLLDSREIEEPELISHVVRTHFESRVQVRASPPILMVGEDSIEGVSAAVASPSAASDRKGDGLPQAPSSILQERGDSQPLVALSQMSWSLPDGRCRVEDAAAAAFPGGELLNQRLVWCPSPNRYLMMICGAGRMGNRLMCIMNYMVVAAFLNRTLVFPLEEVGLPFGALLDVPRIRKCLGPSTVISLKEFRTLRHADDQVDMMRFFGGYNPSIRKGISIFKNATGITIAKSELATARQKEESTVEFFRQFSSDVEVLSVGELFGVRLSTEANAMQHGREPWSTPCNGSVLQPHEAIVSAALNFTRTFLGSLYTSVHLRRGDFLKFCAGRGCFYPIPQLAKCLRRQLEAINASDLLFLATDAEEEEVEELVVLLERGNSLIRVVRLSGAGGESSLEKTPAGNWERSLTEEQRQVPEVVALVELTICAFAKSFLYSRNSTFSREIRRLRAVRLSSLSWNPRGLHSGAERGDCRQKLCEEMLPTDTSRAEVELVRDR
ncbi:hypothetical protein CBR_g20015 [Chara braunii]|uniref:GDP-fucose protein O-fucosyltransferase 2 n=1 Tax=Chara braunii TaxID=69332 RepID=A0A388KZA3_CHABU|nr:hypothetical protein CBR_g20015 [Chara braunii]|eukprot:GBG75385.1 hypothetical protein CBR_g20015 [Chara braunii]